MKKILVLLLSISMLLVSFSGCDNSENPSINDESTTHDESTANDESTAEMTGEQHQPTEPNPASEFKYEINEGKVVITGYVGSNSHVVIPNVIDDVPVTKLNQNCFFRNFEIESVYIPDSITVIGFDAFLFCPNLKTVRLSSRLEVIEQGAFEKSGITEITLPNSLTEIGRRAFADCPDLKHVTISKNLNYGEETFSGCGLETVIIEEGVETIASAMFACTNIREIVLPNSIKTIGMNAFGDCESLESVTLNEGLTLIDTYAFANTKITEIIIPQSVIRMNDAAFLGCSNIQKVKFKGDAPVDYHIPGFHDMPDYIVCYHKDAKGFTSPEWNGYPTEIW